jgi:hypothetical protein
VFFPNVERKTEWLSKMTKREDEEDKKEEQREEIEDAGRRTTGE